MSGNLARPVTDAPIQRAIANLSKKPINGEAKSRKNEKLTLPKLVRPPSETERLVAALEESIKTVNGPSKNGFERAVDRVITALSKPGAVWAQTGAIAAYIALNVLAITKVIHFDPYPFLFLNTLFSLLSAYTTVFVLNSNGRQDKAAKAMEKAELAIYKKILLDLEELKRDRDERKN